MKQKVIKTYPPAVPGGLWLDVMRDGPGEYSVCAAGNSANPIVYGFILPIHAEEWIVELQAQQRGWVRIG
jgi:hypothetical protein